MARKTTRYTELKIKGQPFVYSISIIRYRDKKGHFAKFNPRRKLKVEVYGKREVYDKRKSIVVVKEKLIRKHSLGFAKRKKATTKEHIEKLIERKATKAKGRLEVKVIDGLKVFLSVPQSKRKGKAQVRRVKIPWWTIPSQDIEKELDERLETFESSLPGNS